MTTCKSCRHFLGMGDWSLCCALMHDLCYEDTEACSKYEAKQKAPRSGSSSKAHKQNISDKG